MPLLCAIDMKKILSTLFIVFVLAAEPVFAGVAGSKHDMFAQGKGTDTNMCSYCHVPHNAAGEKIWSFWPNEARLTPGYTNPNQPWYLTTGAISDMPIENMCFSCHDGTAAGGESEMGLTETQTVFYNRNRHKTWGSGDCDICHTVHDNTNGNFLIVPATQSAESEMPTYCETCHGANPYPGAGSYGNMLAGSQHPYKDAGWLLNGSCNSCHTMHGGSDYTTTGIAHPILKTSNADSVYCEMCHNHEQKTTGGNRHPANLSAAGGWGKVTCESCHDPHQPDTNDSGKPFILLDENIDSGFCTNCHDATSETNGPMIGGGHPVNRPFTVNPTDPLKAPAGNTIDDNTDGIIDYPLNTASMVCESCHSVHRKGIDVPALRDTKGNSASCINCHGNTTGP